MQKYKVALIPIVRSLQVQPSRNLFFRPSRLPSLWNPRGVSDLENNFLAMDRHFDQLRQELMSPWGSLPQVFLNLTRPTNGPMRMYESELDGKYQMNVSMGAGFKPENIKVTLKDHDLTVEAKYDHTSEDGKTKVYQEFMQMFSLPKNVDPAEVKSKFTPEGILQIEAPLSPEPDAVTPKEIPIQIKSA